MQTLSQAASVIYMIRPVAFCYNTQTAVDNVFQIVPKELNDEVQAKALKEFDNYVATLKSKGVNVIVFEDTKEPHTPDSIFPNDWVSYHEDGTYAIYPMFAANRRQERREDIMQELQEKYGYKITRKLDFTKHEEDGKFLEGAGVLIFDYPNKIVYCSVSNRAQKVMIDLAAAELGYKAVTFQAVDDKGTDLYHTTVVMALGEKFAIICEGSVCNPKEKEVLFSTLEETGHEIISITFEQMYAYAGNALEVQNDKGERFLALSKRAYDSLTVEQRQKIEKYAQLLPVPLEVIEDNGGGSARCMLGDMRLPKKN
jgi:hypothetical protein